MPILLVANDRSYMREYGNGALANALGFTYLVVVVLVAAVPLLVLSNMGQG